MASDHELHRRRLALRRGDHHRAVREVLGGEQGLKVLFVVPSDRTVEFPKDVPVQTGVLGAIADADGHKVDVIDLNALREVNTDEAIVKLAEEAASEDGKKEDPDLVWVDSPFGTFSEARRSVNLLRQALPDSVIALGGGAATAEPTAVLRMVSGLDVAVVGEQEDALVEVLSRVRGQRWEPVKGLAYRSNHGVRRNPHREPREDLDAIPFPNYYLLQMARYFQFSPLPLCREAQLSKRRLSFSWQRERVDKEGKAVVSMPSPRRAALNVASARFKYGIDFALLLDEGVMASVKWFDGFLDEYMKAGPDEEGLHDVVPFVCWADPAQVVRNPDITRKLKDAGCKAVQMKVDTSEPVADSLRRNAMELFRRIGMPVVLNYVVGTPSQTLEEVAGMMSLGLSSKDAYVVLPPNLYPDGPYFERYSKEILAPYGGDMESFVLDSSKTPPLAFNMDYADMIAVRMMVISRDVQGLLRLEHLRGKVHPDELKARCPVCRPEILVRAA